MERRLKTLGLTFALACALGALLAPAASAIDFHSEAEHTVLTGVGTSAQVLKTGAEEELSCKTAAFAGTVASEVIEEVLLAPAYGECKFKSGKEEFTAHVKGEGCAFALTASNETEAAHLFDGAARIECEPEAVIRIGITVLGKEYACLSLPAQSPAGVVEYTREGEAENRDFKFALSLTGVENTREGLCGEGSFENATLSGEATVTGESEGKASIGIWVGEEGIYFHSEATHTILDGSATTTQVFEVGGDKIECASATLEGSTISGKAAAELTAKPAYSSCMGKIAASTLEVRVTTTGCYELFASETATGGEHYVVHIECEKAGEEIHFEVFAIGKFRPCYTIPQQTPTGGGAAYTNKGPHIEIASTLTGIEYTKASGICGPAGTANNATFNGSMTVAGTDTSGKEVSIWFG